MRVMKVPIQNSGKIPARYFENPKKAEKTMHKYSLVLIEFICIHRGIPAPGYGDDFYPMEIIVKKLTTGFLQSYGEAATSRMINTCSYVWFASPS